MPDQIFSILVEQTGGYAFGLLLLWIYKQTVAEALRREKDHADQLHAVNARLLTIVEDCAALLARVDVGYSRVEQMLARIEKHNG